MSEEKAALNVYVSWENLRFEVPDPNDKNEIKTILNNLNGHVLPGELVAVIGPSGSGKSSFLNCVAGRTTRGVTGDLLFNGVTRPTNFARFTGYVVQDDLFFESLTVRETLVFAANLKLPLSMPKDEKKQRVEDIIEELDLRKCENTQIGTIGKGISGGERRRLAIGLEIVNEPSLLLLDEPTTGLDSASALMVGRILQRLAKKGITILCTIHQPRYALATMFDKLYFLAKGNEIYFGPTIPHCLSFFENAGYRCPEFTNPADFLLDLVNTAIEEDVEMNDDMDKKDDNETIATEVVATTTQAPKEANIEMAETQTANDNNEDENDKNDTNAEADDGTAGAETNNEKEKTNKKKKEKGEGDEDDDDEDSDGFIKDMLDYASDDSDQEVDNDLVKVHTSKEKEKENENETEKEKENATANETTKKPEADANEDESNAGRNSATPQRDVSKLTRDEIIEHLSKEFQTSKYRQESLNFTIPDNEKGDIVFSKLSTEFYITPWYNQFWVVLQRSFIHKMREPIALMTQVFNSIVIPLIFGSMYWQIDLSQQASLDRVSAISIVILMLSFFAFDILLLFPIERDIFNRENASGMYRPSMFYFGRTTAEFPQHIILMGVMGTITYFLYGLQLEAEKFAVWILIFEFAGICSASLLLLFGAMAKTMEQSNLLATFFLVLFMLFDGNWISVDKIPILWKWVQYISLFAYGTQAAIVSEYRGLRFDCTDEEVALQECFYLTGNDVLADRGLDDVDIQHNLIMLFVLTILYRVLAFFCVLFLYRTKPPKQIFMELFQ